MGPLAGGAGRWSPTVQDDTARQDLGKPDNCQECRQENDDNYDVAQHGSLNPIRKYLSAPIYTERL